MKKQIWAILVISEKGIEDTSITFVESEIKPNPSEWSGGSGNVMMFKLVDGDYSANFAETLESGDFIEVFGNKFIKVSLNENAS